MLPNNLELRRPVSTYHTQARRQDLAGGGQKPGGVKNQKRGAHFKNTVLDVCSHQGAKHEMGGTDFKWGDGATLAPPLATALITRSMVDHENVTLVSISQHMLLSIMKWSESFQQVVN